MPPKTTKSPEAPACRRAILETVCGSRHRVSQNALETSLCARLAVPRRSLRAAVRTLVAEGELTYTSHFGCSFLEASYQRPVLVSGRVVVKPPACRYAPHPDELVVSIAPGSAFGGGDHPTTRLALRAIEHLLAEDPSRWPGPARGTRALDVGTGSGILVIASVLLGIEGGIGIDTDGCARSEARHNVTLNHLENRIVISDSPVEALVGAHTLVTANLRYPTLARLADCLARLTASAGGLVLSGIRPEEAPDLKETYVRKGFDALWSAEEAGWGGIALRKRSSQHP